MQIFVSLRMLLLIAAVLLLAQLRPTAASAVTTPHPLHQQALEAPQWQRLPASSSLDTTPDSYSTLRREDKELRRLERAERNLTKAAERGSTPNNYDSVKETATASLVLGIAMILAYFAAVALQQRIFIVISILAAILAALFGLIAINRLKYGARGPRGLAIAGMVLGFTGILLYLFAIAIVLTVFR